MDILKNVLLLMMLLVLILSCKELCDNEIIIYEGLYYESGQSYELSIEDVLIEEEYFNRTEIRGQNLKKIDLYCCKKDSCKVEFTLDSKDTVFYISPKKTKRLMVGSSAYGNFSVATDENKDSWIRM